MGGGALSSNSVSKEVRKKLRNFSLVPQNDHILSPLEVEGKCARKSRKVAFTKPSRGTSEARDEQESTGTLSSRCDCERCRLMRGAVARKSRKIAFTLAEVLITLGIIGVVVALTLPSVINNFREKQLETAFKKTNNIVTTALNETMAEYGIKSLTFKDLCSGYTNVGACTQANSAYFEEINSYFLSRFNIVKSTTNTFGNAIYGKYVPVDNFYGTKRVIDYGGMYGMTSFGTPWHSVNFLNDGSVVSALTFFYHNVSDGVTFTFDTNGPYRGPNRYGYDIFIRTSGTWYKPCSKVENGLQGGIYNGRGCYEYAQMDVNPDDKTKSYWKSLY